MSEVTKFSAIYDVFLTKVTDDMYMEMTELDTYKLLQELLISAIPWFEFPRKDLNDYEVEEIVSVDTYSGVLSDGVEIPAYIYSNGHFNNKLTIEEINILATYMVAEWIGQQLASIENTRQKFSGTDFKFTSQANHMGKLKEIKADFTQKGFHLQRLYKRRKVDENGNVVSTLGSIMEGVD